MNTSEELRLTLRIPGQLAEELRALAAKDHRSLNSEIVTALEEFVKAGKEGENKPVKPTQRHTR